MNPHHQRQQYHHQHKNYLQQQRFSNATGSGGGVLGVTTPATAAVGGIASISSLISPTGIEPSTDISNKIVVVGAGNVNNPNINVNITNDEIQTVPTNPIHHTGNYTIGTASTATSVTAAASGVSNNRRLQTADFNRHSGGRSSDNVNNNRRISTDKTQLENKIASLIDTCETPRFPFKKKILMLDSLRMTAADIPVKDLYETALGQSLYKLSMSGNRLSTIPRKLVTCLPSLKSLDISQCELHQLPERWHLPQLKKLNLSLNRLTDFPEEVRLTG